MRKRLDKKYPALIGYLYTVEHKTMQQIADQLGVSKPAVYYWLKKDGIDTRQGTWVQCKCNQCGKEMEVGRSRYRAAKNHYCSEDCYYKSRASNYHGWRQGQRRARANVAKVFPLEPRHIVHHIDRDNRNNDLSNLMVFANSSDHLKHHHNNPTVQPLFSGNVR